MKDCKAVRHGIQRCEAEEGPRFRAFADGRIAGRADTYELDGRLVVGLVDVNEGKLRSGIGTKLYEAMLETACERGLVLASDTVRSPYGEAFWRKQQARGRASCRGTGAEATPAYKGSPKQRASLPQPDGDRWPCERFEVRAPCAVTSLEGTRRRRKRR